MSSFKRYILTQQSQVPWPDPGIWRSCAEDEIDTGPHGLFDRR